MMGGFRRATLFALGVTCVGGLHDRAAGQEAEAAMPGAMHQRLGRLEGEWQVHVGHGVSEADDSSPAGSAVARMRLGGRFLEVDIEAERGPVRHALYTFGFDTRHDRFAVIAMDETGTYFVTAQGHEDPTGNRIAMYGTDDEPVMQALGLKKEFVIVLHLLSDDHFVIETRLVDTRTEARNELPFMAFSMRRAPASPAAPTIQATNAFYYYADVEGAWTFYTEVLGLETVVDYGFAKILRVAPASYLTLVDARRGMHSADEPKSVTLAIVTEQVEAWYDYLISQDVPMRAELSSAEGRPHDGFVAVDPEGYYLEFERFNPHPENRSLTPVLREIAPLSGGTARPEGLTIQATVLWLYYRDVAPMQEFYERLLGVDLLVDQGWAKVYQASGTGFLGLVDGSRGLHEATDQKGVTVSFFTDDVDGWFERVRALPVELRTPEVTGESGRVRVFVAYDAEGYFLEWDTFLPVASNDELLRLLGGP